ncbi:MAG: DNA photolyase [Desulfobacterales bacterium]|nr:DNA photolyase [Desulfobacterales bacterium]
MTIRELFIDAEAADHPQTAAIRSRLAVPARVVPGPAALFEEVRAADDPAGRGKQVLFLTRNRGAFLKACPGTRHYTCCGYRILHVGSYCTMDCAYCILQAYFHPPLLQYYVNQEDMTRELEECFSTPVIQRIGTGEFTDSLIWEPWTNLSRGLVQRFAAQRRAVLELKTKSVNVAGLLDLDHRRKTILAWSLNTERVIREQERGTAALGARLRAAAAGAAAGYPLAFHFDPVVIYDGCEAEYREVAERLFAAIPPEQVVWISLGAFRFMPDLKALIQRRFPDSRIVYGEFITGLDGKARYFKPLRIQVLRSLARAIREFAPHCCVYLCMEDDEVWRHSLGFVPAERGGLPRMLDSAAARHCGVEEG